MKKEKKTLLKYFILLFLITFLIFNWGEFSWLFNYKAVSIIISKFFSRERQPKIIEPTITEKPEEVPGPEKFEFTEKENILEIPRLEISPPFFLMKSTEEKEILKALDRGVVLFSDYALPGESGTTIILGHSARHDWPKTNPAWVFTYLRDAIEGDEIILHFNHRKYPYYVTRKFTLKEGEEISSYPLTDSENMLMLVTCWPPGRLSLKERLVVEAQLKSE